MSGTYAVTMGDRGRLVIPAELRERLGLAPGVELLMLETEDGLVLSTRDQAKRMVRARLAGPSLVDALLAQRRRDSSVEDRMTSGDAGDDVTA